ncbi:respiratory nitrate reductase 1 subunit alpha [Escherichia coli]|uniref:Respiratory nitrate reductase 1 subunit alpha n=1 Tax=Escherichia coli TaxID=562 RepID=A0A376KV83_ECOLX|nr:respiratory nitrate reductase 1 subunit alpha [Escherichia coli]
MPIWHTALTTTATVGSNRDEFVVVRKMKNIDWLDGEGNDQVQESVK